MIQLADFSLQLWEMVVSEGISRLMIQGTRLTQGHRTISAQRRHNTTCWRRCNTAEAPPAQRNTTELHQRHGP